MISYVEIEDEDGHHFVHKSQLNPGTDHNRRECYMCGSRRHWTKDCPREDGMNTSNLRADPERDLAWQTFLTHRDGYDAAQYDFGHAAFIAAWAAARAVNETETVHVVDVDAAMWESLKKAIQESPHFAEMYAAGGMFNDGLASVIDMLKGPFPDFHLAKGGKDPNAKLYSALDVEAIMAISEALHRRERARVETTLPPCNCGADYGIGPRHQTNCPRFEQKP